MKPEEAIEELRKLIPRGGIIPQKRADMIDFAISALKQIQQYREIGSVEQVKNQKENLSVSYRIISDYESIGTPEECREAVEKQKPKKPVLRNDNGKLRKSCPVCGCFFSPLSRSCPKCGQAILQENKDD